MKAAKATQAKKARCEEPGGCTAAGVFHPVTPDSQGGWCSPRLYCRRHRAGKAPVFIEQQQAIRMFGVGWRLKATETRPSLEVEADGEDGSRGR